MSEQEQLPVFNNGITPNKLVSVPVVEEFPPMLPLPVTDDQRRALGEHHLNLSGELPYQAPVEAVPGVGGIPGVQAEE